ncbi:MAG TPA: DUF6308 family protein [Iamia sp.]|nr:DUF6308 family protein [Iamia sp.]
MTEQPIALEDVGAAFDERAVADVAEYFATFTGRRFDTLGGGGSRPGARDRFDADDIVAVSLLSVDIPGEAVLTLLDDDGARFASLLGEIPTDVDLWDADDDVIGPGSPADQLWRLVREVPGCGWVTAGKLLARKRPRLLPVYDGVVREELHRRDGDGYWRPLRDLLRDHDSLQARLLGIRTRTEIDDDISLIRVLDVALWMSGKRRRTVT